MGGFAKLFKSSSYSKSSDSPPAPSNNSSQPTPLWALATEPAPRRNGFGPRPPSKTGMSSEYTEGSAGRAMGPRQTAPPQVGGGGGGDERGRLRRDRQRTGSLDELSGGFAGMGIAAGPSPSGRGPLPSPPRHKLIRPAHHQRAYSSPTAVPPTLYGQSNAWPTNPPASGLSSRAMAPPSLPPRRSPPLPPRVPPPPSIRSARSYNSAVSGSSYAPSQASWQTYGSATSQSSSLYPQAVPTAPRPPSPPGRRGPSPYRQALPPSIPPSTNTSPGTNSALFPGAFPISDVTAPISMPEPRVPVAVDSSNWTSSSTPPDFLRRPLRQSNSDYQQQLQQPSSQPLAPPLNCAPRPSTSPNRGRLAARGHGRLPRTPPANLTRPPPQVIQIDLSSDDDEDDFIPLPSSSSPLAASKKTCSGTTASGKRCTRGVDGPTSPRRLTRAGSPQIVLSSAAVDVLDGILEGDDDGTGTEDTNIPRFCFQHSKQAMQERGCFVNGKGGRGVWIEFDDWILPDLPVVTKILLRHEMARPVSTKDEAGYIYVHEMVEKRQTSSALLVPNTTLLKLGRSVKPVSRLSQWRSQCPSREPIVRDIFPRPVPHSYSGAGVSGALQVADSGIPHHHRWERLMLIEVAGRASLEAEERQARAGHGGGTGRVRKTCADCGKSHSELFEVNGGAYEDWVKDVVERWMRWCGDVLHA